MRIEITNVDGHDDVIIEPSDEAIALAAESLGYQPTVPDPSIHRAIELKQSEFLRLDPNDPTRNVLRREIALLEAQKNVPVDNPQTKESFLLTQWRELLTESATRAALQKIQNDLSLEADARQKKVKQDAEIAWNINRRPKNK